MNNSEKLLRYKLSIEELVFILFNINCGKIARYYLSNAYENLPEEHLTPLLTAARNSLIARGYCFLDDNGRPVVAPPVQEAVFNLASCTSYGELLFSTGSVGAQLELFLHPRYGFTTLHYTNSFVVTLTHARYEFLEEYVQGFFPYNTASVEQDTTRLSTRPVPLEFIPALPMLEEQVIRENLTAWEWPQEDLDLFLSDIARVMIIGSASFSDLGPEKIYFTDDPIHHQHQCHFLQSDKHFWLFNFAGGELLSESIERSDRDQFMKTLAEIVSKISKED